MFNGQGVAWSGLLTAYRNGLAAVYRRPIRHQVLRARPRPPVALRQTVQGPSRTTQKVNAVHSTKSKRSIGVMNWSILVILVGQGRQSQVLERLKEVTCHVFRIIVRQCEVHTAQKFRRGLQLYSVYSRMWGEEAARAMFANFRRILMSRGRHMLLSAVCFSNFNWNKERIPEESLQRAVSDLDSVGDLCRATVECESCGKRQVIDQQMANIDYCNCKGSLGYTNTTRAYDSWEPFIEREHHIVWRQRHRIHKHLYAYKVYGTYDDVSLSAFVEVQLNSSFRSDWDDTALQLRVLDSDQDTNSDLMYWLVKFPCFFANRDYLFKRRFTVNEEKNEVVIMSESINPDYVPEEAGVHRVNEYWSTMVIRAREDAHKPGLEYTLTYFDNPGTSLPERLTNFIAATGFPNFLKKVHRAALSLQAVHEKGADVYVSLPKELRYPKPKREVILERSSESSTTQSKELEVSVSPTVDIQLRVDDSAVKCERPCNQENRLARKDAGMKTDKDSNGKSVMQIHQVEVEDTPEHLSSIYDTQELHEPPKILQCDEESDVHGEEPSRKSLQEIINSDEKDELPAIIHQGDTIKSDVTATKDSNTGMNDSDEIGKEDSAPSDRFLQLGSKNVAVNVLEGMEVIAPDLERKTLLLKKIENIKSDTYSDFEKQSVVMTKIKNIKNKIRTFRERALQKKMNSLKKMEELTHRDHYHHSDADEKTLKHLEMLFQAMRDVLKADKDIRTGKGLMDIYANHEEKYMLNSNENSATAASSKPFEHSQDLNNSGLAEADVKDLASHNCEHDLQLITDKKKQKQDECKDSRPPDAPPPSESGGLSFSGTLESPTEGADGAVNSDVAAYNKKRNDANLTENESEALNWWSAWVYVPNISAMWDYGKMQNSLESSNTDNADSHCTDDKHNENRKSFLAQVLYVIGLGWIFHAETEIIQEDQVDQENKLHMKGNENLAHNNVCDTDSNRDSKWYWHPVSGIYRVFVWAFSNSKENA